jgi:hypothetical protein
MVSFDFNFDSMLSTAASVFNAFSPIILAVAGIAVGIGLAFKLGNELRRMF